ncbi:MAG: glycosyltransferase family 4 protein [Thermoanaerobaculaceae bacterium]|nr:glycosyltransferase family 4 protein [Thermoanaerobaculaceae bacterium]MDI9621336.1 glycosyltransferase family 4 protein [Acidobacteriota bacterium]HPW54132.1 glycosyltransferase family 4 protein [Thermoanaerobaculaceae bacterium]
MKAPLRIAMLSHLASPCAPTGAEHSLAALATGLVGRGHTVAVVAPGRWSLEAPLRAAGVEVRTVPSRACWLTYWEPRPWPVVAAKWLRYAWPQPAADRLVRELAAWRADVVHVNCLPHLRGVTAARRVLAPRVWHLREILPPGPRRRWWARKLRGSGAGLVAVSEAAASWIRAEGLGARVSVVPNGIVVPEPAPDTVAARVALGLPADVVLAGFVGQLAAHKGARLFVEAAAQAMRNGPGLHAVLAGGGPPDLRAGLERVVAETGLAARFHLLAAQPSGLEVVAACDVVCVPTLTPDPLPRVVMEAMAAGRPVVGSASGGIPEMLEDGLTGLLVPPGDREALTAAVVCLARDAQRRAAMGAQARRRCQERFSLDRHLARMEALLLACSAAAKP